MKEFKLSKILISENSFEQVIVLQEKDGNRSIPIIIGIFEALAIDRKIKEEQSPRPLTHDLLINVIAKMDGHIDHIVITDLNNGTFFAKLVIRHDDEEINVDSRPSDAIALALREQVSIFVADPVLEKVNFEA